MKAGYGRAGPTAMRQTQANAAIDASPRRDRLLEGMGDLRQLRPRLSSRRSNRPKGVSTRTAQQPVHKSSRRRRQPGCQPWRPRPVRPTRYGARRSRSSSRARFGSSPRRRGRLLVSFHSRLFRRPPKSLPERVRCPASDVVFRTTSSHGNRPFAVQNGPCPFLGVRELPGNDTRKRFDVHDRGECVPQCSVSHDGNSNGKQVFRPASRRSNDSSNNGLVSFNHTAQGIWLR
jgi:hypothetical protein